MRRHGPAHSFSVYGKSSKERKALVAVVSFRNIHLVSEQYDCVNIDELFD